MRGRESRPWPLQAVTFHMLWRHPARAEVYVSTATKSMALRKAVVTGERAAAVLAIIARRDIDGPRRALGTHSRFGS